MADGHPAASGERGELVRYRLDLAYDGTDFAGWGEQPHQRTVAAVLRRALETLSRSPVRLVVAGRTDAGVHALGQVVHADVPARARLPLRNVNGLLPSDIRVSGVTPAPAGFDARFAALSRTYRYRVTDSVPDPLRRRDTLAWRRPLDLGALRAAADQLVGLHDFAAFCRRRDGATTVRTLLELCWRRDGAGDCAGGGVLTATVVADAFCHSMVRSLIGALLAVGDGRRPVEWPAHLLGGGARCDDVVVAPAHGLTLLSVQYPEAADLAVRAERTRARRIADRSAETG